MKRLLIIIVLFILYPPPSVLAEDAAFRHEDRERLIRLEVMLQEFKESVNERFEVLRDDMNKRFEQIDKRFEQVDKRFEQMFNFLWIITGIFTTLTLGVIGFAYWDRRTIIKKAKEETISEIERQGLSVNLLKVLRELAKEDNKVADVLRQFHLL